MPDDLGALVSEEQAGRHDRPAFLGFVGDQASEATLREGLAESAPGGIDLRRATVRQAIASLQKLTTPLVLLVDVSGEEQPLAALADLSEVVEPDVRVLVLGDRQEVNFYRQLTRGLGVAEYLYKPLTRDMVARHFGPVLARQAPAAETTHGGRIVTVTGVKGGVGASTIAANLAWHFATAARRHTVLLDADLHTGTAAMLVNGKSTAGLRAAIEMPQRMDELFLERAAQPVQERLHLLASEERLLDAANCAEEATQTLLRLLSRRYNFVVADVPFGHEPFRRELLQLAHQRVLIMDASLPSIRDALRLLALPNGPRQARRAVLVLNRAGQPGLLTRKQVEDALKLKVDVTIGDHPKLIGQALSLGEPAVAARSAFRTGILELAREVAFVRLLDAAEAGPVAGRSGWLRRRRG